MTSRSTRRDDPGVSTDAAADPSTSQKRIYSLAVWQLAFGYFAFYAPYSSLVKVLSRGLLPGTPAPASPFVALPVIGFATALVTLIVVTRLDWWKHCRSVNVRDRRLPWPGPRALVAGIATAAIIYTTTLMFTFSGVSIVVALVIMRGGVLLLAPIMDLAFRRRVRWFAWTGLTFVLLGVGIITVGASTLQLGWALGATAAVYVAGYLVRLHCVNTHAKCADRDRTCQYFVEELLVAMAVLVVSPFVVALFGDTRVAQHVREGLTTFLTTRAAWTAVAIGVLYGALYCFGTLIYLDRRENTFCIALNRGASLLAGIVGAFALAMLAGERAPGLYELAAAATVAAAIVVLSPLHHAIERLWMPTAPAVLPTPAVGADLSPVVDWPRVEPTPTPAVVSAAPLRVRAAGSSWSTLQATPGPREEPREWR